ncbi:ASCH domain-containing protein [Reinekea thalattae]|uniref:ASCH domain-containing protein n=1 Tax=Reinekea thalattae TaxID=2593301 RepID=A0A5C8ZA54_9GAMM|nr:ASCH domain-containing protein [Reinekea thalattae]TXR54647.1 ASCH domain-containing protein [Reinekea thalattae]
MNKTSQEFLQQYLSSLSAEQAQRYSSFSSDYFCADKYNADLCAELVLRGEKTATCSLDYWYSHEGEQMPRVGHLQVVTNYSGEPVCIIETTQVSHCCYQDVTAEFAEQEGEGDKTLSHWRESHWDFFAQECQKLNIEPTPEMLLVLERFKMVYPKK